MLQRKHGAAIQTRRNFVLPDYEAILGRHPFCGNDPLLDCHKLPGAGWLWQRHKFCFTSVRHPRNTVRASSGDGEVSLRFGWGVFSKKGLQEVSFFSFCMYGSVSWATMGWCPLAMYRKQRETKAWHCAQEPMTFYFIMTASWNLNYRLTVWPLPLNPSAFPPNPQLPKLRSTNIKPGHEQRNYVTAYYIKGH